MSIMGLTDVVFNKETGKYEVVPQKPTKSTAEPVYKIPVNKGDDPEAIRADRAAKKPT